VLNATKIAGTFDGNRRRRRAVLRPRVLLATATAGAFALSLTAGLAQGKTIGGCPTGQGSEWTLVTVGSLGIDPETAMGIPSLDGNGDGWTCIRTPPQVSPLGELTLFRDNTV
jgi:hypothetical protein